MLLLCGDDRCRVGLRFWTGSGLRLGAIEKSPVGSFKRRQFQMDRKLSSSDAPFPVVATLFGLTFVTGLIDAVSFLGLGHVFTANMTGNVVFIGFALGGAPDLSVVRSLLALSAFAAGSLIGGRAANGAIRTPAALLIMAMSIEIVFLLGAAVAMLGTQGMAQSSRA